jgi:hypothetical protein
LAPFHLHPALIAGSNSASGHSDWKQIKLRMFGMSSWLLEIKHARERRPSTNMM